MKTNTLLIGFAALAILSCGNNLKNPSELNSTQVAEVESNITSINNNITTKIDESGNQTATDSLSLISFSTGVDNSMYLVDKTNRNAYLYAEVKSGKYEPKDKKRAPLNLSIVIDRSGSMAGDKLDYAKKAAKYVVDKLSENDYLSIVMYDTEVDLVYSSQKVKNKAEIKKKIDAIFDRDATNLHGGMMLGYKQVKSTFNKEYVNRVLLMSDGLANEGITDQSKLEKIAKEYCQEYGISISTFGVGTDFNENLMTGIAEYGCGNYYFIKDPEYIPSIFEKELNGLLNLVAQDVKLTVTIPAGLKLNKLYGYKYDIQGNQVTVHFRDVFSNETKAVLLKFDIENGISNEQKIFTQLTFTNAMTTQKENKLLSLTEVINGVNEEKELTAGINSKVKEQVILFESNDILEQAMIETDNGNYDKARELTKANAAYLDDNKGYVEKSEELQNQKKNNDEYDAKMKDAERMGEQEMKVMQKSSKSVNYSTRKKK